MSDKKSLCCSFTGHRRIAAERVRVMNETLASAIAFAYSRGVRTFLAGGALGFDTYAAKAVILFRMTHPDVRLVLLLPCKDQDAKWTDAERAEYAFVLKSADEIEYISENYTDDCMRERNRALASRADMLIAYVTRSRSGAAQTLRMAEALKKETYNIAVRVDKA